MTNKKKKILQDEKYLDWLAGLTDGDGCFTISKKGYVAFELSMETRDIRCLYNIKTIFGGSIKPGKGKWEKYRLHHKAGITHLVNALNGRLRNPVRLLQFYKVCELYNIEYKETPNLVYNNSWLSGFLDADGSIYLNKFSVQIFITASQKNKYLLDLIALVYGGCVKPHGKEEVFKWTVSKKSEVLNMLEYFKIFPLMSKKMVRINLIKSVYAGFTQGAHKGNLNIIENKKWDKLMEKWDNYS